MMIRFNKMYLLLIFIFIVFNLNAQKIYKESKIDSIARLSTEQLMNYVDEGNDMNEILYMEEDDEYYSTVFTEVAHSYGYYCDEESKMLIYHILMNSKNPIKQPFFFLNDACSERKSDILEYYKLLHNYHHGVTEDDFELLYNFYYDDVNYVNDQGKTALMYACEFNYIKLVKRILKQGAKTKIKDPNGKIALDYCSSGQCEKLLKKSRK